jgi:hypothetical protein
MKIKFLTLIYLLSLLQGCSTPPKPFPKSAENECMTDVFDKIRIVRTNTPQQSNSSKEEQCLRLADFNTRWDRLTSERTPKSVQNAAGQVVVQQSFSVSGNRSQSARDTYYKECLNDPKVRAFTAPPAYTQLEGISYGFSSIETDSCPTQFAELVQDFVQSSKNVVRTMKQYPQLNSAQHNEIIKNKVPRNPMEKEIIDADKQARTIFVKMVYYFANATGWCPSDNGIYRCDPNNIRFKN